jgi:hypothetical protein
MILKVEHTIIKYILNNCVNFLIIFDSFNGNIDLNGYILAFWVHGTAINKETHAITFTSTLR